MIGFLLRKWRERQRKIDREILFPSISREAKTLLDYRNAVRLHIVSPAGRCWRVPFGELNADDITFIRSVYKEGLHGLPQ